MPDVAVAVLVLTRSGEAGAVQGVGGQRVREVAAGQGRTRDDGTESVECSPATADGCVRAAVEGGQRPEDLPDQLLALEHKGGELPQGFCAWYDGEAAHLVAEGLEVEGEVAQMVDLLVEIDGVGQQGSGGMPLRRAAGVGISAGGDGSPDRAAGRGPQVMQGGARPGCPSVWGCRVRRGP